MSMLLSRLVAKALLKLWNIASFNSICDFYGAYSNIMKALLVSIHPRTAKESLSSSLAEHVYLTSKYGKLRYSTTAFVQRAQAGLFLRLVLSKPFVQPDFRCSLRVLEHRKDIVLQICRNKVVTHLAC